ncbi:hypothetical protein pv_237 [Pithovirus sibericum]|uniref:Uncharacterized protein n=1 Tax=Pithovirus sibericum TaxID=1450746 RepID=W5S562_9VIRU|nr:hypothetical protein pv_237 [Pithovirus sibericum]AHH01804.1 hypothetical protein pv_237 [Pithovirus sibericum]
MCFSLPVSLFLVVLGIVLASYHARKQRRSLRDVILFYTLMELLQSSQQLFPEKCGETFNFWSTILAHILVVVQPLMWNLHRAAMYPDRKAIFLFASLLSALWAVFYTLRLIPSLMVFGPLRPRLDFSEIMVGQSVCTHFGPTHLYWVLPYFSYHGLEPNLFPYLLLWFVPALYEDSGKMKITIWLSQIIFIQLISSIPHELPTIWCAYSIPFLISSLATTNTQTTCSILSVVQALFKKKPNNSMKIHQV